jgi:hypothetical protein
MLTRDVDRGESLTSQALHRVVYTEWVLATVENIGRGLCNRERKEE